MTRVNARGRVIESNYGVRRISESAYECEGCGRRFSAFDLPHYSLANEAPRLYALNKGRAMRHADRCRRRRTG